jgi:hypothetical protein
MIEGALLIFSQLFGVFAGIFALGIPIYFLNPKVSSDGFLEIKAKHY